MPENDPTKKKSARRPFNPDTYVEGARKVYARIGKELQDQGVDVANLPGEVFAPANTTIENLYGLAKEYEKETKPGKKKYLAARMRRAKAHLGKNVVAEIEEKVQGLRTTEEIRAHLAKPVEPPPAREPAPSETIPKIEPRQDIDDVQRLRAEIRELEAEAAKPGARKDIEKDILMREGALRALEAAKAAGSKGEAKTGRAREIRERLATLEREAASPADYRHNHDELEKEVLALEKELRERETKTPASEKKPDTPFFSARNGPPGKEEGSAEEQPWSPSPLEEQQSAVQGELYERYRRNAEGPFEFDAVPESVHEKVKDFFDTRSKNIPPGGTIPESEINAFLAEQLAAAGKEEQVEGHAATEEQGAHAAESLAHEETDRSAETDNVQRPSPPAQEAGPIDEPIIPNPDDAIDPEHAWAMRRAGATGKAEPEAERSAREERASWKTGIETRDDGLEYVSIVPPAFAEGTRREWYEKLADLIKKLTK